MIYKLLKMALTYSFINFCWSNKFYYIGFDLIWWLIEKYAPRISLNINLMIHSNLCQLIDLEKLNKL